MSESVRGALANVLYAAVAVIVGLLLRASAPDQDGYFHDSSWQEDAGGIVLAVGVIWGVVALIQLARALTSERADD